MQAPSSFATEHRTCCNAREKEGEPIVTASPILPSLNDSSLRHSVVFVCDSGLVHSRVDGFSAAVYERVRVYVIAAQPRITRQVLCH